MEMDIKLLLGQSKVQLNDVIHRRSNATEDKAHSWLNLKGTWHQKSRIMEDFPRNNHLSSSPPVANFKHTILEKFCFYKPKYFMLCLSILRESYHPIYNR